MRRVKNFLFGLLIVSIAAVALVVGVLVAMVGFAAAAVARLIVKEGAQIHNETRGGSPIVIDGEFHEIVGPGKNQEGKT